MKFIGDTKTGLVRSINQDSILLLSKGPVSLFVVADGMGGHTDGEKASHSITDCLKEWWKHIEADRYEKDFFKLVAAVRSCIEQVNKSIYDAYNDSSICGSTVSILLIFNEQYAVFHVGDSRIYKFEKRKLCQITMDEVWENDIRTRKKFSAKEIISSNKRGKLINAIGTTPDLMMTIKTDCLSEETIFLLCSDGLYKMVKPSYLQKIIKKLRKGETLEWGLKELMNKVYSEGAKDNVSIILIRVGKG